VTLDIHIHHVSGHC